MTSIDIGISNYARMRQDAAATNYSDLDSFYVGESNTGTSRESRSLIKPDFSGIASGRVFESTILKITPVIDSFGGNAGTVYVHRCLRNVVYNKVTWNVFSTGNGWGTAGCYNSSNDYDGSVVLGSVVVPAAPTLNTPIEITLNAAELQKLYDGTYTNYGLVLFVETPLNNLVGYATQLHATEAYRPIITIEHSASITFIPGAMWF